MPALRKPLTPAQALARGRRTIADRRAAEAWAKRPAWTAPVVVETTVAQVSPAAPERWPRVWRAPVVSIFAPSIAVEKIDIGEPSDGCAAAPATEPEKAVDLSTGGGAETVLGIPIAEPDQRVEVVPKRSAATTKPTTNIPKNITGPVRPSEGKRRTRQSPSPLTQHGAATPGKPARAAAGNVAKPQPGPTPDRIRRPSDDPTRPALISAAAIEARPLKRDVASAPKTEAAHPSGAWPLTALREGQCRFACTPHDAASHRFCGAPVAWLKGKPTSWCSDHLPVVTGAPGRTAGGTSVADALAGRHGPEDGRRSVDCVRTGAWR